MIDTLLSFLSNPLPKKKGKLTHSLIIYYNDQPPSPTDVISDILTRLPTKTLTRFRSVCKPWRSLLSNPSFIKSHLRSNHSLSLSHDDVITSIQNPLPPLPREPLQNGAPRAGGLVCLTDCSLGFMLVLWNPATKTGEGADRVFVGFGLDLKTDDCYVICVFKTKSVLLCAGVMCIRAVGECGGSCWGRFFRGMWCICGDGDYGGSSVGEVCVSFDVESEVFRLYDLPKYEWNRATGACIVNLRDSVAGMMFSTGADANKLVDVYVLDEGEGTWSKMYTVGPIELEVKRVLQCFIDGEIVVEDVEGKLLYDPKSGSVRSMRIDRARELAYKEFDYIESLVTLDDMKPVKGDDRQETSSPSQRSSGDTSRDEFLSRGFKLRL